MKKNLNNVIVIKTDNVSVGTNDSRITILLCLIGGYFGLFVNLNTKYINKDIQVYKQGQQLQILRSMKIKQENN